MEQWIASLKNQEQRDLHAAGLEEGFQALEEAALRGLTPVLVGAGLESRAIVPGQREFVPFILAVLAESAGLEESVVAAQRWFGDLLDAAEALTPAA